MRLSTLPSKNHSGSLPFCAKFVAKCYDVALQGQTSGHIEVVHACKRHGNKYSSSYSFGCKIEGRDATATVLNAISGYIASTQSGSTVVVTEIDTVQYTDTQIATTTFESTAFVTWPTTLTTGSSTSTTTTVPATETDTITTTVASLGTTTTTGITTRVTTLPFTSTTMTTSTILFLGEVVPVTVVTITGTPQRREFRYVDGQHPHRRASANTNDDTFFCQAFSNECALQCSRVHSSAGYKVCRKVAATDVAQYRLACLCTKKKVETQHALAAVIAEQPVSVSTVKTETTTLTSTALQTATTTMTLSSVSLSTDVTTSTLTLPIVQTRTETGTTTTSTLTTATTPTTTTVAVTPTAVSSTSTPAATITIISTTQVVLAPTGAVQLIEAGQAPSYLHVDGGSTFYTVTTEQTNAANFMAIRDPASGLYQLQNTVTQSSMVLAAGRQGAQLDSGSAAYAYCFDETSTNCGADGVAAMPYAASQEEFFRNGCEVYSFDLKQSADGSSFDAHTVWWNAAATEPEYVTTAQDRNFILATGDVTAFSAVYTREPLTPVTLRFPVTL